MAQPSCRIKQNCSSNLMLFLNSEQKADFATDCRTAAEQATSMELMNSRSEVLKGMNIPKLMKFFISLGSEYSFFLFYIIETIKMAPMEGDNSSEKLISSLSIIFLEAAS